MRILVVAGASLWTGASNASTEQTNSFIPRGTVVAVNGTIAAVHRRGVVGVTSTQQEARDIMCAAAAPIEQAAETEKTLERSVSLTVVNFETKSDEEDRHWKPEVERILPAFAVSLTIHHAPKSDIANRQLLVCPGFIDSHVHFFDGGRRVKALSLLHCNSKKDFIDAIRKFLRAQIGAVTEGQLCHSDTDAGQQPFSLEEGRAIMGVYRNAASGLYNWLAGYEWSDVQLGAQPSAAWIDEALRLGEHQQVSPTQTPASLSLPVVLTRIDCHSCVLNSVALELCGINEQGPPNPEGGTIERDSATSAPTGILREKAMGLARTQRKQAMRFDNSDLNSQYDAAASHLLANGITACFSMCSLEYDNKAEIEYLLARPTPPSHHGGGAWDSSPLVRIRSVVVPDEIPYLVDMRAKMAGGEVHLGDGTSNLIVDSDCSFGNDFVRLGAVKVFADGALGSRTAAMEHPYGDLTGVSSDTTGLEVEPDAIQSSAENDSGRSLAYDRKARSKHQCPCGLLLTSVSDLYKSIRDCSDAGFQCCVHGIGDRAVLLIQDAFEAAAQKQPPTSPASPHVPRELDNTEIATLQRRRNRIEHCQHVSSTQQLDRFARSHTVPSVQPCHLLFDGDHVDKRLGPRRARLSYPLLSMARASQSQNAPALCLGTDWMVTSVNPVLNIQAAMLRTPIQFRSDAADTSGEEGRNETSKRRRLLPVWTPEERLTLHECLAAYTTDAAKAAFWESSLGMIAPGMKADFTFISVSPASEDRSGLLASLDALLVQEPTDRADYFNRASDAIQTMKVEGAVCDGRVYLQTP